MSLADTRGQPPATTVPAVVAAEPSRAAYQQAARGRFLVLPGCLLLATPLAAYGYLGLYSRYAADDYCTAGQLAASGLLGMQVVFYLGWSGRFVFTLVAGLVEMAGAWVVPVLPTAAMVAWVAALSWTVAGFATALRWPRPRRTSLLTAIMLVAVTLGATADLGQSLFWQTGMLTYLLPLVVLVLYVGLVQRQWRPAPADRTAPSRGRPGPGAMAASGLLALAAGGSSETYVAMQTGALGMAVGLCLVWGDRRARQRLLPLLLAGLAGSAVAFAVVVAAPGNSARQGGHPTPDMRFALTTAAGEVRDFARGFWRFTPIPALLALSVPLAVAMLAPATGGTAPRGRQAIARGIGRLALVILSTAVVLALCFAPSYYALSGPAPGRARIIPQFVLVAATGAAGYLVGALLRQLAPRPLGRAARIAGVAGLAALMVGHTIVAVPPILAQVPGDRLYAAQWDSIDGQIWNARARGSSEVVVPPLALTGTIRGMDFFAPDAGDWLNQCAARYYGVHSIVAPGP